MTATLRDLLNVVFRFGRALVIFWVVTLIAVLVFYTQSARKYDSKARILVSLGSENAGKADYLNSKNLQLIQREQQIHNEQQILLSDQVLQTTAKWILGEPTPGEPLPAMMDTQVAEARRFLTGKEPEPTLLLRLVKVASQGATAVLKALPFGSKGESIPESTKLAVTLSKNLDAKTIFNSDALDVSFRYRDPRVAQTVLKLILAAYLNRHIAVFQNAAESNLLKAELDRSVVQYQARLDQMATFMATHHVFAEDSQINSFIQQRQQLNQSLSDATAESEGAAARIRTFQNLDRSLQKYETYSTTEGRNKLHDELQSKLNEAQVQLQQILNTHPAGSRAYQDQAQVLQRLRELLSSEPTKTVDQKEDRRSGASELVEQQLIGATAAQKGAQARSAELKRELGQVNVAIDEYARNLPGYDMIKLNVSFSKEQSEQMGQAYVNSRLRELTAKNEITDISVIDPPSWQPEPASPKKSVVALLAVALLLLGGVAVVLAGAALDPTMNDRRALELGLRVPVAAVLPDVTAETDAEPELLGRRTENEFARIYTAVRQASTPGAMIFLAGSNGGEGLSLIGIELARFLMRTTGGRAALLDCTPHAPGSKRNGPNEPTLLLLNDLVAPKDDTSSVPLNSTPPISPAQSLSTWRKEFDYIVLTCNAQDVYKLADIIPSVDAAFLVVEAARTRRATALSTLDLLRSYGVQGIQTILNKRVFFVPDWIVRRI